MKRPPQVWSYLAEILGVRAPRAEVLIVSGDVDLAFELDSMLRSRYRTRTVDRAQAIDAPGTASHWLAIIDTVSPADARTDVAFVQEHYPSAPIIVVSHSPWQWSAAAARGTIIAAIARQGLRSPRLTAALDAAERRLSSGHTVPAAASTPLPLTRSALPLLGLLLLDVALAAWWILAEPGGGHGLRSLLLGMSAAATLLLPLILFHSWRAGESALAAVAARRQTADILGTMREGLFVIRRDLRLGATCSGPLAEVLRLSAPAGRRFEDVLQPLLDAETLAAALTFVQLLWNDEADVHAVEALNPLSQVEVSFVNTRGGCERRYLSFSFRRAAGAVPVDDCILGVVADVTDRVLLARELEQAEADGDWQAELLLQLVRSDPLELVAFLDDADAAFRKSNAILTASGSGQQHLQRKLSGVLRELDAVTAEAAALPFASFAQRLYSIDDVLSGLSAKSSLSGNDFLPVVVRLDELMSHAATMRTVHQHIVLLRAASAALAGLEPRHSSVTSGTAVLELS
jgi:hypothetical protein